ncbi:MAG: cyclopropane-fatty-acyl-phospholipid synthase family protein [Pseudomonadota bacterium]
MTNQLANDTRRNDPDLAGTPFFFRRLCAIASRIHIGVLQIETPDGRILTFEGTNGDEPRARINIRDYAVARRTILGGDIGFFESYTDGQWETPDLTAVLLLVARNAAVMQEVFTGAPLFDFFNNLRHFFNRNTRSGSRKNIIAHYDLGNEFYEKWLDETMTYSAARFETTSTALNNAQTRKYETLARSIDLKPGESVLEIGSGWGGFAEFAAKEIGANVTGLTISPSQYAYAKERIQKEGLSEKVDFRLQDYRDVEDRFDKVASIEMFEAVGREYWDAYFEKVRQVLRPGGRAGMQIITIADQFFDQYAKNTDFIQRYVFPGGMLPSPTLLRSHIEKAGLEWERNDQFGLDYAETLRLWQQRFLEAWDDIRGMGFDQHFKKLWQFYLAYCEAGFKAGTINVGQVTAIRPA